VTNGDLTLEENTAAAGDFSTLTKIGSLGPVSVKSYGAKGDGVTADTAAFVAAFAANKKVYAPAGTYLVSTFSIPVNGELFGDGPEVTIIKGTAASIVITVAVNNVRLHGFTIDGNDIATYGLSVFTNDSYFSDIKIKNTNTSGVYTSKLLNVTFDHVLATSNNGNGWTVMGRSNTNSTFYATTTTFIQCQATTNDLIGFEINGHSIWTMNWINCIFEANGKQGFKSGFVGTVGLSPNVGVWTFLNCHFELNNSNPDPGQVYNVDFGPMGQEGANAVYVFKINIKDSFFYAIDVATDGSLNIGTIGYFSLTNCHFASSTPVQLGVTFPITAYPAGGTIDIILDKLPTNTVVSHTAYTVLHYDDQSLRTTDSPSFSGLTINGNTTMKGSGALGRSAAVDSQVMFQLGSSSTTITNYDLKSSSAGGSLMGTRFGSALRMDAANNYHYQTFGRAITLDDGNARALGYQYGEYWAAGQKSANVTITNAYTSFFEVPTIATAKNYAIGTNGDIEIGGSGLFTGSNTLGAGSGLYFTTRSYITSPADGNIKLARADGTTFGLLQLGGTTSSFSALKRDGVNLRARLADDSADTGIVSAGIILTGTMSPAATDACTAGTITWDVSYIYVCTATGAWKRSALTGGY
jgi:hypothetical protein